MDGILIVNKPQGMTSHDVVDIVRRLYSTRKVGHAGTLDPMATGVLVTLIGKATKSSQDLISEEKEYVSTMVLGARSDTGDAWGSLQMSGKPIDFNESEIRAVFSSFEGEIEQTPPAYSAKKVNGEKLYHLARRGESVDVKPQKITVKELSIISIALPEITFRLVCSKGTYVRQVCADIGEKLGCGAYMSKLERTRSGDYLLSQSSSLDELKKMNSDELAKRLMPA